MKSLPRLLSLVVLIVASSACDSGTAALECTLDTDAETAPVNMTVMYTASASGDSSLDSVTYLDDSGNHVVNAPGNTWSKSVSVSQGSLIGISGRGSADNGEVKVSYAGDYSLGLGSSGHLGASDSCSQTTS